MVQKGLKKAGYWIWAGPFPGRYVDTSLRNEVGRSVRVWGGGPSVGKIVLNHIPRKCPEGRVCFPQMEFEIAAQGFSFEARKHTHA